MKQGEIYLVRFPFTDLTSSKLRPAIVISNSTFNNYENFLFIGIFGNKGNPSYSMKLNNESLEKGKLTKDSYIRFQNTFSLHKSLIVKKAGSIKDTSLQEVIQKLHSFTDIKK